MFVDRVRVHLQSGNGGAGVVSFVRSRGRPAGKPMGGSGGDGGDIVLVVDSSVATLLRYQRNPHHAAGNGTHGRGDFQQGRRGDDLLLPVPPGTVVFDDEGVMIADLVEPGQRVVVLPGGKGGRGNAAFVSPTMKAPSICEQGEYGAEASFTLELKLIADAALVGFPNAGKSTLISTVSAAKPKIADYPFTTLVPHLGVATVGEREIVLADIPGLIEGAAEGRGLGHEFLRHVERARVIILLLDPSELQDRSVADQFGTLVAELGRFSTQLGERPRVVAVTKADLPDAPAAAATVPGALLVSARTGLGIRELLFAVAAAVGEAERAAPEREGYVLHRPVEPPFGIIRDGSVWVVTGLGASRAVRFADLTNPQAAELASRRLARLGVDAALAAAGARPGDTVRIGDLELEYVAVDHEGEEE